MHEICRVDLYILLEVEILNSTIPFPFPEIGKENFFSLYQSKKKNLQVLSLPPST